MLSAWMEITSIKMFSADMVLVYISASLFVLWGNGEALGAGAGLTDLWLSIY